MTDQSLAPSSATASQAPMPAGAQSGPEAGTNGAAVPGEESDKPFEPKRDALAVVAELSPTCVRRGGTIQIAIRTVSFAGVAYHAVYAGEVGGAPPPYGGSHGGNDGGQTDAEGRYFDEWIVGPLAPLGKARVDVVVGKTDGFGETKADFWVADPVTGLCDQENEG